MADKVKGERGSEKEKISEQTERGIFIGYVQYTYTLLRCSCRLTR